MIGRADIEESKSNDAKNAKLLQASYPCGHFFETSIINYKRKGSLGLAFTYRIITEKSIQISLHSYILLIISNCY